MFDKDFFTELLLQAMGDLNTTEYSKQSGVNRTYISKLLNKKMDNPPSPEILKGLAGIAKNNVTYTDFMKAAGYIEKDNNIDGDIMNPPHSANIKSNNIEEQLPDDFETPEEAIDFLLNKNVIMGFGGFDVNKLSDDEKVEFAHELLSHLKLLSLKYKK